MYVAIENYLTTVKANYTMFTCRHVTYLVDLDYYLPFEYVQLSDNNFTDILKTDCGQSAQLKVRLNFQHFQLL